MRPTLEEIFRVLQSVLSHYSSVYVVIDALDECQDKDGTQGQLLAKLRDLQCKTDLLLLLTFILPPAPSASYASEAQTSVARGVLALVEEAPKPRT